MTAAVPPPPLKRLGQHFLTDPNIARKIVTLAGLGANDTVLEIGPGRGALTGLLAERAGRVIAVEVDARLRPALEPQAAGRGNIELVFQDALAFPYETLPRGTVVVANLPYYLSSPLLFRLFEAGDRLARMVLMLQTEVAVRLAAPPGSRRYGVLSVLAAYQAEVQVAFSVSRNCFRPRPEVGSSVVTVGMRTERPVSVTDEPTLRRIIRAAFAHRRKTVSNSLRDEGFAATAVTEALRQAAIAPSRRAETLTLAEFATLANAFYLSP